MTYTYDMFERDCYSFNKIAKNLDNTDHAQLGKQFKVLAEEVKELAEGLDTLSEEEILDGAVDVAVVITGFLQLLHRRNYNVVKALEKTAKNNLSKFPKSSLIVKETIEAYAIKGISCTAEYNDIYDAYVIKNEAGKIMKPLGFVPNDLSDCLPNVSRII